MIPTNLLSEKLKYLAMILLGFLSLMILSGCAADSTPEEIVASFRDAVEEAVEQGHGRTLRSLISEQYFDERGRTKAELGSIASGYLLRNRSLHVLSRISKVERLDETRIVATILAAFTARPVQEPTMLPSLNADIYWFEIILEEEGGDWLLRSADWRRAMVDDFLGDSADQRALRSISAARSRFETPENMDFSR